MHPEETRALGEVAALAPASGAIVEIGTAAGGSLVRLLDAVGGAGRRRVIVVDPLTYFPGQRDVWELNLKRHGIDPAAIDLFVGRSARALRKLRLEELAFVLIDGGHKLKDVIRDTRWLGRLRTGGIAAIHDCSPACPGVERAVAIFLRRNPNYRQIRCVRTLLFIERTGPGRAVEMPAWRIWAATIESVAAGWRASVARRLKQG